MRTRTTLRLALLLASTSLAFVAPRALADDNQPPPPPQGGPGMPGGEMSMDANKRLAELTKQLKLTPEQQDQIRPLLVEQSEAMKKITEARKKMESVLTPEQREKLASMRPGPRGGHDRHGPPSDND